MISGLLLLLNYNRDKINFRKLHMYLAILLLINAAYWKFSVIIQNNLPLARHLPLHFCGIAPYLLAFYLVRPSRKLFDVLFYWITVGYVAALLLPDFLENEFVGFFFLHGLPLFVVLYLILVREIRPSQGSYWTSFIWLNIYAFAVAAPVNLITGANYVFLREPPSVNFGPIKLLPPWPWYIPVIGVFFLLVYWVIHHLFLASPKEEEPEKIAASQ
jgi:hypothetical integral membrane protein (TIGR02206 family)